MLYDVKFAAVLPVSEQESGEWGRGESDGWMNFLEGRREIGISNKGVVQGARKTASRYGPLVTQRL